MSVIKDKPVILQTGAPVTAYLPKATTKTPGIAKFDPKYFRVAPDGTVSLAFIEAAPIYIHYVSFWVTKGQIRGNCNTILVNRNPEPFTTIKSINDFLNEIKGENATINLPAYGALEDRSDNISFPLQEVSPSVPGYPADSIVLSAYQNPDPVEFIDVVVTEEDLGVTGVTDEVQEV